MSDNDDPRAEARLSDRKAKPRDRLRFGLAIAGGVLIGAIGGTGGLALAAGAAWHGAWHHGPRLGMVQAVVGHVLDSVGATAAQEARIHDIIASTSSDLMLGQPEREAMRRQVVALLRAPTIDRAAIEKLRADQVVRFDATSKTLAGAVAEAAEQLTPAQRVALADRAEAMIDNHRRMEDGPPDGEGRGDRHGPESAPAAGPDKD